MKAQVKLKPTRLRIDKYNQSPLLVLEFLSQHPSIRLINVIDNGETFDLQLPFTKHSIKPIQDYINLNISE